MFLEKKQQLCAATLGACSNKTDDIFKSLFAKYIAYTLQKADNCISNSVVWGGSGRPMGSFQLSFEGTSFASGCYVSQHNED